MVCRGTGWDAHTEVSVVQATWPRMVVVKMECNRLIWDIWGGRNDKIH